VIERLYRGSIINHRSFLLADVSDINGKCAETMTIFYLTFDDIKKIRMKNSKLNLEILKVEQTDYKKENPYVIDYIMCRSVLKSSLRSAELEERRNMLTCKLKNAALQILITFKAQS
jgi:hypothetical protein